MESVLTILAFEDTEKGPEYLNHYLKALRYFNDDGLRETQIIVITQKKTTRDADAAIAAADIPVTVVKSDNPFVDGRPIWDVLKDIRKAWKHVKGDYVTFNHTEFIWCKSRLRYTIEYLKRRRPYLCLCNLRRPASDRVSRPVWRPGNCDRRISDPFTLKMKWDQWSEAAGMAEVLPTLMWPLWRAELFQFGPCVWSEDAFIIDRRWSENWNAFSHGGELPFQDVYDVMGSAIKQMEQVGLGPQISRMTEDVNRIIHVWHPKNYRSWTPEIRDWFLADPQRWKDTEFLNRQLWDRMFRLEGEKDTSDQYAKFDLRRSPRGTVTRYENSVRTYLNADGAKRLRDFYRQYGVGERVREYTRKDQEDSRRRRDQRQSDQVSANESGGLRAVTV